MTAAVSVASKVATAAKGAGKAGTAAKGAGARASRGARAGAGGATKTAAQQRAAIDQIKANRPPEAATPPADTAVSQAAGPPSLPSALTDGRGAPGWWGAPDGVRAANAGGGFLLGLGAWVLVRTYLDGGAVAVKKLLKAKFFNEVD